MTTEQSPAPPVSSPGQADPAQVLETRAVRSLQNISFSVFRQDSGGPGLLQRKG